MFGEREEPLSYSKDEMVRHDRDFQRQLRSRFDEKRLGIDLGGRTLRSELDIDCDVEP